MQLPSPMALEPASCAAQGLPKSDNIVIFYGFHKAESLVYMVMEKCSMSCLRALECMPTLTEVTLRCVLKDAGARTITVPETRARCVERSFVALPRCAMFRDLGIAHVVPSVEPPHCAHVSCKQACIGVMPMSGTVFHSVFDSNSCLVAIKRLVRSAQSRSTHLGADMLARPSGPSTRLRARI